MPELQREPDFSARALASGLAVGGLLCVANLYMGLKTGIWDSGHVTASVLAFALASGRLTRLENNIAQTAATAAGAVPAAAGLLGAVPALEMLGRAVPGWGIALWGLALAVIGILFGAALRQRLLEEEKLPFPTGVATAEVIEALQAGRAAASGRTRPLMWGGVVGAVLGWFRDGKPALIPGAVAIPGSVGGVPLATLGIGVSLSPLLWGVGMVVGLRIALSMLLGSVLGWGVLAPWLVSGRPAQRFQPTHCRTGMAPANVAATLFASHTPCRARSRGSPLASSSLAPFRRRRRPRRAATTSFTISGSRAELPSATVGSSHPRRHRSVSDRRRTRPRVRRSETR